MSNFKVCYSVKYTDKEGKNFNLLVERKNYFENLQDAFKFCKEIYGSRNNGYEVVGKPSIERM